MDNNKQPRAASGSRPTLDGFNHRQPTRRQRYYLRSDERRIASSSRLSALEHGRPQAVPKQPLAAPSRARIDMELPGNESKPRVHPTFRVRARSLRRRVMQTAALTLAMVIGGWSLLFVQGLLSANKAFQGNGPRAAALEENVDPDRLKGEGEGRINILLLGIGGSGHKGPDLTDTMILASIDPVNHTTSLVSIPRDLWVKVPKHGSMKINAAYATGKYAVLGKIDGASTDSKAIRNGFTLADQTVQDVLGVKVHYNLLLNFQAFRQAVEAVDGITVDVPTTLYDPAIAWENGRNPIIAKAGQQQFDGKQALLYVRSRSTTSDFARSERQRAVMVALKQKVVQLGTLSNPLKLSGLLSTFGNNVTTDLSLSDASRLYSILKDVPENKVSSVGLADEPNKFVTTGRVGNQSVVIPEEGLQRYGDIQDFIKRSLPDGYILKEKAKVLVLNGTTRTGLADAKATQLRNYGYNVIGVANAPTKTYQKTLIINLAGGKNPYTRNYLEQRYDVKATSRLPDSSIQKGAADLILIIGSDEAISQ